MGKPHKHAEIIKAWADGAEIQCEISQGNWCDIGKPDWHEEVKFRIKPELPKYPQTSYSETTLACICHNNGTKKPSLTDVANMAIARAILDGDVVAAAMLEKVAQAVRAELVAQVERYSTGCATYINGETDLAAIINRVKEGK